MFGLKKSPLRINKSSSVEPGYRGSANTNPFDSDDEIDHNRGLNTSRRTTSEPMLNSMNNGTNPFDDDGGYGGDGRREVSSFSQFSAVRNKYKNDFSDCGGIENQSVQELESYAAYKAEETTKTVDNCLKIAEGMREGATNTLVTLHHQGEQITRTHYNAVEIDYNLSRGEKLLGSLGGIFSKTWKPKKNRPIKGPVITRDDSFIRRGNHLEQREKLGLAPLPNRRSRTRTPPYEPTTAMQHVEAEKAKQDEGLSHLSDILGELKNMAIDMGSEIDRQNKSLDPFHDDVEELHIRVKGANRRGRHLLGK